METKKYAKKGEGWRCCGDGDGSASVVYTGAALTLVVAAFVEMMHEVIATVAASMNTPPPV